MANAAQLIPHSSFLFRRSSLTSLTFATTQPIKQACWRSLLQKFLIPHSSFLISHFSADFRGPPQVYLGCKKGCKSLKTPVFTAELTLSTLSTLSTFHLAPPTLPTSLRTTTFSAPSPTRSAPRCRRAPSSPVGGLS